MKTRGHLSDSFKVKTQIKSNQSTLNSISGKTSSNDKNKAGLFLEKSKSHESHHGETYSSDRVENTLKRYAEILESVMSNKRANMQ